MIEATQRADRGFDDCGFARFQDYGGGRGMKDQWAGVGLVSGAGLEDIDPVQALGAAVVKGQG